MRRIILAVVVLISSLLCGLAHGSRPGPGLVKPVIYKGIKFIAPHYFAIEKMGFVEARDSETNQKVWEKKVYDVVIDPSLEEDVQSVFITSISIEEGKLVVINEKGSRYVVDIPENILKDDTQSLQLTIKSDKEGYKKGEEVLLTVTLKNVSTQDISIPEFIIESRSCELLIQGPNNKDIGVDAEYGRKLKENLLGKGQEVTLTTKIPLVEIGEYKIRAKYNTLENHIYSNTITIEVIGNGKIPSEDKEQLKSLIEKSDLIVLGKIVGIYDGTAIDGGMTYDVEVEKLLYGKIDTGNKFRFNSGGWVDYARYQEGEKVLLFLVRHWPGANLPLELHQLHPVMLPFKK